MTEKKPATPPPLPGKRPPLPGQDKGKNARPSSGRKTALWLAALGLIAATVCAIIVFPGGSGSHSHVDDDDNEDPPRPIAGDTHPAEDVETPIRVNPDTMCPAPADMAVKEADAPMPAKQEWESMLHPGSNNISGRIRIGGTDYPIRLVLDYDETSHRISSCSYHNLSQGVTLSMTQTHDTDPRFISLSGQDGTNLFTLRFAYDGEGTGSGTATLGGATASLYVDF